MMPASAAGARRAVAAPGRAERAEGYRVALAYAAFAAAAFLVSLVATLPHRLIATRALESTTAAAPLRVEFSEVGYAFPNGYRLGGVRIAPLDRPDTAVQISTLTVRVPLLGLVRGRVDRISVAGSAYGGTFRGEVDQASARIEAGLHLESIDLGRALPAFLSPPAEIGGRASLELQIAGDGHTTRSADGDVHLSATGLTLAHIIVQGLTVPDMSFAEVDLSAQIHGGRVQVKELRASGPDLGLSASGDLLLREPLQASVLSLRLNVTATAAARPEIRLLTAFLPHRAPGEQPIYNLSGTFAAPLLR